jgi:hypothetical protein
MGRVAELSLIDKTADLHYQVRQQSYTSSKWQCNSVVKSQSCNMDSTGSQETQGRVQSVKRAQFLQCPAAL